MAYVDARACRPASLNTCRTLSPLSTHSLEARRLEQLVVSYLEIPGGSDWSYQKGAPGEYEAPLLPDLGNDSRAAREAHEVHCRVAGAHRYPASTFQSSHDASPASLRRVCLAFFLAWHHIEPNRLLDDYSSSAIQLEADRLLGTQSESRWTD